MESRRRNEKPLEEHSLLASVYGPVVFQDRQMKFYYVRQPIRCFILPRRLDASYPLDKFLFHDIHDFFDVMGHQVITLVNRYY